jgi:hypothetical protein
MTTKLKILLIDISINVLFPISIGILIYCVPIEGGSLKSFRNYLPDGLWSYSFTSCILILWERKIVWYWLLCIPITFLLFEFLQYCEIINGTADIYDIIIYIAFMIFALITNKPIKKTLYDSKK